MYTKNKPIAVICPNNIVKFYTPDGRRDMNHSTGLYKSKDLDFYKQNYIVKFIQS